MAATQTTQQLLELFHFLQDPKAPVRRIALASLLPYTAPDAPERKLFLREHHVEQLATMCADQEIIAHDALSALINLSSTLDVVLRLHKLPGFVTGLVRMIIDEKALLADLACMLLSNMSKLDAVARQILALRVPFTIVTSEPSPAPEGTTDDDAHEDAPAAKMAKLETATEEIAALDLLLEVFLKGEGKKYNPNANYDFLASVFANVSLLPQGRAFLLATPDRTIEPPLVKLISFTEHPSTIRRGGVASTIKNAAFEKAGHTRLVASSNDGPAEEGCIDLLVQLLLPLCGNEEFDIDVLDELPAELQLLPSSKEREPDAQIRTILVETLVLLATGRHNRESMRKRGVYPVIKEAHAKEAVPSVKEPMVRLVNLLMRDEGPHTAVEELDAPTPSDALPPAPSWTADTPSAPAGASTAFVGASGETVEQPVEARGAQPGAPALGTGDDQPFVHNNVPLSRMQPEEDEDEMLLEV
ncbi:hypothetical protein JCM9279_004431 [Rhodotorula babjevae]